MLISMDGQRLLPEQARISVFDRGFLFGDAIYEVIATQDGRLFQLGAHLDRLETSGAAIGLDVPAMRATLEAEIRGLIAECSASESYIRVMITRGASPDFDLAGDEGGEPVRIVLVKPLPPWPDRFSRQGVRLKSVNPDEIVARIAPSVKSNNRQANVMAHRAARAEGADDALFVDPQGNVSEGPSWNVFGAREGAIWTPKLVGGILPGITRSTVLRLCAEEGIGWEERDVPLSEALEADELFVTSTTRGVMPVCELDGRAPRHGSPGPLTERIRAAWRGLAESGEA